MKTTRKRRAKPPDLSTRLWAAQRDLRMLLRRQETLSEVVCASLVESRPALVAEVLIERASAWMPVETWGVMLCDGAGPLSLVASTSSDEPSVAVFQKIGEWIGSHGREFFSPNLAADSRVNHPVEASVLGFALVSRGRTIGALVGFEPSASAKEPRFGAGVLNQIRHTFEPVAMALEQAQRVQRIEALSVTDDLTGLYNSRYLKEALAREAKRAVRYGRVLSVLFVDLDGFKNVNDQHGHMSGSRALVEAATVIRECARESDVVARYGGDEFVMVLPETGCPGATVVAERVKKRLSVYSFLAMYQLDVRLTASIGVATLPADAITAEEVLQAADQAMYRVKERGKNGICLASDPEPGRKE